MEGPPPPLTSTTTTPCWSAIAQKPPAPKPNEEASIRVFENCKSSKGIAVAVVDANAIIQGGDELRKCADKLVSVNEVMAEVKDPASRRNLTVMLSNVETMEPSTDALKTVVNFARETGDLQTLSDVDLKLIALTYTLEAQIHGTTHLRARPPPVHTVNVKRLTEKEMPGWGSNVPNLEEWEALEHAVEVGSNTDSKILPLRDLNLNVVPPDGHTGSEDCSTEHGNRDHSEHQDANSTLRKPRRYMPMKKEIKIEGKKMVADGIDASQGQIDDDGSDWLPAVSRSTHRRYLRRKARRELYGASSEKDDCSVQSMEDETSEETGCHESLCEGPVETQVVNEVQDGAKEEEIGDGDLSSNLEQMRLDGDMSSFEKKEKEMDMTCEGMAVCSSEVVKDYFNVENVAFEGDATEICDGVDHAEISSQTNESVDSSFVDDSNSEQSWMLRSLSESSVACVTTDFAMQNVILQIGLRLLAPGGMQIRQLQRWILKCHACNKVTAEIGRIFCPKCGNGGTLRKVAVTVGENGVVLAARRPRITLRGTKFSLPSPQGGRDAITKNPILREDQLPHKVLYPKTKKKANKEGDDIFIPDNVFCHTSDKRAPLQPPIRKALAVFSGKRNPNDNHYSRSKH